MNHLRQHWQHLLLGGALLSGLALALLVRDAPLQWRSIRVDSLTAFFTVATLAALLIAPVTRRTVLVAVLLLAAYSVTLTPLIALLFAAVAVLSVARTTSQEPRTTHHAPTTLSVVGLRAAARRVCGALPLPLAAMLLLVGYGALALGGALRYDDRTAGAALGSFAFWFVLLAAVVPLTPLAGDNRQMMADDSTPLPFVTSSPYYLVTTAWIYPLVRLYSLGPWNTGWSYATLLLGGAVALWAAASALTALDAQVRLARVRLSVAALALAGCGMGTGAGLAAGCYGVLALLVFAPEDRETARQRDKERKRLNTLRMSWSPCLVCVAPFIAVWMLVGAATAGGAAALAGAAWLAALLAALALLLGGALPPAGRSARLAGALSVALALGAPLIMLWLIEPVIEQLQGGLTPYGDVIIWPWVGLAIKNAANAQVAALPSLAVAALMLVLVAIVYLLVRLRETFSAPAENTDTDLLQSLLASERRTSDAGQLSDGARAAAPARRPATLVQLLRDEVPWLNLLLPPSTGARHIDGE